MNTNKSGKIFWKFTAFFLIFILSMPISIATSSEFCHFSGKRGIPNKIGMPLLRFLYVSELERTSKSTSGLGAQNLLKQIEGQCSYNAIFMNTCSLISTAYSIDDSTSSFEVRIPHFEGVEGIENRVDRNIFYRDQTQIACKKLTRKELERRRSISTEGSSVRASIWHTDRALSFATMDEVGEGGSCKTDIVFSRYSICRIRSAWRESSYIEGNEYVVAYRVESSFFD